MKIKEAKDEILEIIALVNSFHEFHYDPDADDNLARAGIGVHLDFHPRIYLRFNSQDLSLDPNGDLEFFLVGWQEESDGFTYSPRLKAITKGTEAYLKKLPRSSKMPFWGYQDKLPWCYGDCSLLSLEQTNQLRAIFSLREKYLNDSQRLYMTIEI